MSYLAFNRFLSQHVLPSVNHQVIRIGVLSTIADFINNYITAELLNENLLTLLQAKLLREETNVSSDALELEGLIMYVFQYDDAISYKSDYVSAANALMEIGSYYSEWRKIDNFEGPKWEFTQEKLEEVTQKEINSLREQAMPVLKKSDKKVKSNG